MPTLNQLGQSLAEVMPFCQVPRFPDGLAYCIEVSIAGAEALRTFGVKANAELCAMIAADPQRRVNQIVGLDDRSARMLVEGYADTTPRPNPDNYANSQYPPVHCIIHAEFQGWVGFIDLTVGQLWLCGFDVPLSLDKYSKSWAWPTFRFATGISIRYLPCPYPERADRTLLNTPRPNFAADVTDLLHLAAACKYDMELLHRQIQANVPEDFDLTNDRLAKFRRQIRK